MIHHLHHKAYRWRDSEALCRFYWDFLGLRLAGMPESRKPKSRRRTKTLHTFYEMADGSYLAFFEAPDMPFEQEIQHDYGLHIALEVNAATEEQMLGKGKTVGIETRGAGVVQAAGERRRAVSRAECDLR